MWPVKWIGFTGLKAANYNKFQVSNSPFKAISFAVWLQRSTELTPKSDGHYTNNKSMDKYISILRGINVGGNRKILMSDLKSMFEKLGFSKVQTYIQSGNVIFESEQKESNSNLEQNIQQMIVETFGFDVPVIVRTADEWTESIVNNPFWKEPNADIDRLHLTFLKEIPSPELLEKIKTFQYLPDRYEIIGSDVFIFCAAGYGTSKLINPFFESKLKTPATTRNWKTVIKLHEMTLSNI
jgi:uncharacterized protein (DUF1697 family)